MSRYAELVAELRKLGELANEDAEHIDPPHALQRVAALERTVRGLMWLNAQMLKEMARRDGVDVA